MPSGLRFLFSLLLLYLVGVPAAAATDRSASRITPDIATGKRVALVLGNSTYAHAPSLPNPVNDARDISALLKGIGFHVTEGIDLTKQGMEEQIRAFAEEAADAAVTLFYYAGHGMQVDGRNYLIPIDAELDTKASLDFETVDVDRVLQYMVGSGRIAVALLDACRDNPLSRRFTATRSAGVGRGLAMPATGGGIMIGFATAPGETAADGDGRNSPFATALLRHLATPGTEISQTMRRVMADVSAMTGDRQRPWVHSDIAVDFYMLPTPATAESSSATPALHELASASSADEHEVAVRASPTQELPSARSKSLGESFGVFENETFELCGFKDFSAVLMGKGGAAKIGISSRDRNIPGRSFRGFELSLPLETPTKLWNGCVVAASYDAKAGITRIMFSVSDGR